MELQNRRIALSQPIRASSSFQSKWNGFGQGRKLGSLLLDLFSAYGFDPDSDWQHYLGVLDGKPVSSASVFYATGVAGIYAVGTQPEARRQAISSAVTLRALLEACERGYRVGVLQSSKMGYNVYRNMGFETCFIIKTYAPAGPAHLRACLSRLIGMK